MNHKLFFDDLSKTTTHLVLVDKKHLDNLKEHLDDFQWQYLKSVEFSASYKSFLALPDKNGQVQSIVWSVEDLSQLELLGYMHRLLPSGYYKITDSFNLLESIELAYLGFALGSYQFNQYQSHQTEKEVKLYWSDEQLDQTILKQVEAIYLTRDLINTPANDLNPETLELEAKKVADTYNATFTSIVGDKLLEENYPLIHAVGRASDYEPRLVKFSWGEKENPHVALIGKGVCYDTGGLTLKPPSGMKLMKKDMGGAAQILGLAKLIMSCQLPLRITVYLPIVENSVSANAYRVGDIIKARNGKTVEILNTDAEGRLVLADALVEASDSDAELLIDFATLTGAARVALGMDIPAMYSNSDLISKAVESQSEIVEDLVWHMPLYSKYKKSLKGGIADLMNVGHSPYAGSIVAALFLEEFVNHKPWLHFDISGWRDQDQPTYRVGGDAIGLRAVFSYLCSRYA